MRVAVFARGMFLLVLSSLVLAQTTIPTQNVNLSVGGGSRVTFGPNIPPCTFTGAATGYDTSIVSVTTATTSTTIAFTLQGLSAGMTTVTLNTAGSASSCYFTQMLVVTVTGQSGPLQIPGGGGAAQVALSGGTVGKAYSQPLPVTGGTSPYTWSLLGGGLPAGISLSSSGLVSGVPTQAGGATFTAKVMDSAGASATSIFTISTAPQPLTITTAAPLPGGLVNLPYPPQVLMASGGTPPYSFQATSLPAGLTVANGMLSGTPTAAGSPIVTLTVKDSGSPALTASSQFPITISPARTDLLLSQAAVSFTLTNGANGLPPAAKVSVESTSATQPVQYSVSAPTVPWLTISGGTTAPGTAGITAATPTPVNFSLNSQALSLTASAQTSITVTCNAPSSCAGNAQTITIKANVGTASPQLTVTSSVLAFSVYAASPQPQSQTFAIQNTGGGTLTVNSVKSADSFLTITGAPSAPIAAGSGVTVTATVTPSTLAAGFYRSSIVITTTAGSVTVPVTVLVSQNATMTLNPAGTLLVATAGALPGNPSGSFQVGVNSTTQISWTATQLPGANWLTLNTTSGSSTAAAPGTISFTINSAETSLAPGAYYGAIVVTSTTVSNSPLTYIVVLNVNPATVAPDPFPAPAGLLFTFNGTTPPSQIVKVFASSATPLAYQVGTQVSTDISWLSSSRTVGQTSSAQPGVDTISVNPAGLAAGVYTGGVSYAMSSAAVRTVNVTLIVESGATASDRAGANPRAAGCTPAHLVPTQTGLVNTFSQPAAWPVPLSVLLVNDCGQPVTNAQVVTTFSNGDPPLILIANDTVTGTYTATWTPGNTAQQVTITATATATGFPAASAVISGQVTPNNAPMLLPNGTINAFAIAAEPGVPLAPGTIVQIYGNNLASGTTPASTIPLPASLNQTSVVIGGIAAPLYFVSAGQINAQIPFELNPGSSYQVLVNANNALSTPSPIQLTADSPGIAQFAAGQVIAQHLDFSLVTETSPAKPGEIIMVYVAGMGLTNQTVPSGTASPAANVLDAATLTLNGAPVTNIIYAGLTPTVVGLYQIDFQVPPGAPNGDLPLILTQTSGVSNSSIVPVHN